MSVYRPLLDSILFGVALLGVLVAVHLLIQQNRGFDQGCLGFSAPAAVEATFDCAAVTESDAGTILGVSNAVWGLLFYLVVTGLSVAIARVRKPRIIGLKRLRAAVIGAGLLYSFYLAYYQYFVLGEFCALCLISATLVLVLAALTVSDILTSPDNGQQTMHTRSLKRETALYGGMVALVVALVGADILYFSQLEPAQARPTSGAPAQTVAGAADPLTDCYYDPEFEPIEDYQSLVSFTDPMKGNPDAPVTIIEYFEPNCGHCREAHPAMTQVIEEYGDQAKLYYKPVVFWPQISLAQVAALHAAKEQGKFFEMLDRQFELQQQGGLSMDQLRSIATEIGMDADQMVSKITSNAYTPAIQQENQVSRGRGITSVPAIFINGQRVKTWRTEGCLGKLIEEAAAQ